MTPATLNRLKKSAIGLRVTYDDDKPEEESDHIVNGDVTHSNPMLKPVIRRLWREGWGDVFLSRIPARWRVTITGIFEYPNGTEQHEERELTAHCVLTRINDVALQQVEDIRRHGGGKLVTMRFCIECVG